MKEAVAVSRQPSPGDLGTRGRKDCKIFHYKESNWWRGKDEVFLLPFLVLCPLLSVEDYIPEWQDTRHNPSPSKFYF